MPPFSAREGGLVVACAIQLFAYAEVRPARTGFRLVSEDGGNGKTESVNGDKWQQSVVLELKPGVWNIRILADNWKCGPLIREMKIENAN